MADKPSFKVGDKVAFRPSPRSVGDVKGTVKSINTTGEGKGRATFLTVACTDGQDRKVRPGSCRPA